MCGWGCEEECDGRDDDEWFWCVWCDVVVGCGVVVSVFCGVCWEVVNKIWCFVCV